MLLSLSTAPKWRPIAKSCTVFLLFASPFLLSLAGAGDSLHAEWLLERFRNSGAAGILIYMAMVAGLSVLGMPRQALTVLGGYAFGANAGCLFATLGLLVGCACSFYLSRTLAAGAAQRRFGPRLRSLDDAFTGQPFAATLMLRLCPVGSNALLNVSAGVSHVPAAPFFAATAVGYLPQNIVFAMLGNGLSVGSTGLLAVSAVLFAVSTALSYHVYAHRTAK